MARRYLLVELIGHLGAAAIAMMILGDVPTIVVKTFLNNLQYSLTYSISHFVVWWFYFSYSKRVRKAYGLIEKVKAAELNGKI